MHIEWKKKDLKSGNHRPMICMTAVLVEGGNHGKTTYNRVVAHLGSIEERYLTINIKTIREFNQGLFWQVVNKKLDQLNLRPHIREAVEKELTEKVPFPGEEWALWCVTCIPQFDSKP